MKVGVAGKQARSEKQLPSLKDLQTSYAQHYAVADSKKVLVRTGWADWTLKERTETSALCRWTHTRSTALQVPACKNPSRYPCPRPLLCAPLYLTQGLPPCRAPWRWSLPGMRSPAWMPRPLSQHTWLFTSVRAIAKNCAEHLLSCLPRLEPVLTYVTTSRCHPWSRSQRRCLAGPRPDHPGATAARARRKPRRGL